LNRNPWFRKPLLYPFELRGRSQKISGKQTSAKPRYDCADVIRQFPIDLTHLLALNLPRSQIITDLMKLKFFALTILLAAATSSFADDPEKWDISKLDMNKLPPASDKTGVTYEKDIAPLMKASCVRCHGAQRPKGGLRLDSLQAILKGGDDGKVVVPGESKKSLLVAAAGQVSDEVAMPPKRRNRGPGGPGGAAGGPAGESRPNAAPNGGPGGGRNFTSPKPFTKDQVSLLRAWIDQGAK
jgi:hypothetical protein